MNREDYIKRAPINGYTRDMQAYENLWNPSLPVWMKYVAQILDESKMNCYRSDINTNQSD